MAITLVGNTSVATRIDHPANDPATLISMGQTLTELDVGSLKTGDGDITIGSSGRLVFSPTAAKIVPGATSLSLRNNADNADNLIITDAGAISIRGSITATGAAVTSGLTTPNAAQDIDGFTTELITLSTSTTVTDSTTNLLPANCLIQAVTARIQTAITGSTDWKLGDPTSVGRFTNANTSLTTSISTVGLNHWNPAVATTAALSPIQTTATTVRITTTGNATAGKIRVTVFYRQFVPAVS